ncbi:zinc-alpha-2-glyco -like isoform X1 [Labeo rohita]|uniref:Zinc-alpha-2-glyco-like isoform X1 n=1 Tax=Labeo rohita TaxID=84645 RepID=A0A498MDB2_LABRO|nr:zinc-alpha-2-glyco -like isoform X1 [Labeo rohita]
MLDDMIVGYYNKVTKIYVARGNNTNEDDVIDPNDHRVINERTLNHFIERSHYLKPVNDNEMKPKVRLIQKANSDSGGFRVSCLVTGFYPRHINLTLFRDEQPVADHEITGGDLLPNDDGTYQMRKSLEISATDKHKYICSATHLDHQVTSESDSSEPFKSVILSVLIVLALVLVFGAGAILYKCKKKRTVKPKVMLLQQKSQSSRFRVTCLTTGFYPRHINLTLFRDGQPVAVHEITGGDLLPNGDGTYQMRKSL